MCVPLVCLYIKRHCLSMCIKFICALYEPLRFSGRYPFGCRCIFYQWVRIENDFFFASFLLLLFWNEIYRMRMGIRETVFHKSNLCVYQHYITFHCIIICVFLFSLWYILYICVCVVICCFISLYIGLIPYSIYATISSIWTKS